MAHHRAGAARVREREEMRSSDGAELKVLGEYGASGQA